MITKKFLALVAFCIALAVGLCGTVFAYDIGDVDIDVGESEAQNSYNITSIAGKYKTQGRTSIINGGLSLDYTASSIEFNAYLPTGGDVYLDLTTSNIGSSAGQGIYFTVVVDGVVKGQEQDRDQYLISSNGNHRLTLATGLAAGNHSFAVYRQTEIERGQVFIKTIGFSKGGIMLNKPADKDLFIEFVGDSLTTGYGNLATSAVTTSSTPSASAPIYQDGTKTYAFLAAQALNADYSIIARQGIGAYVGYQDHNTYQAYPYTRYTWDKSTLWNFERQPDIVVIVLGANDAGTYQSKGVTLNELKTGFANLLSLVRSKNPNAKIIWGNRPDLNSQVLQIIQAIISEAGGADSGYYFTTLSLDRNGGNGHPTAQSQMVAGNELKQFILNTVLAEPEEPEDPEDPEDPEEPEEPGDGPMPGDINNDGKVDLKDVTALSRYIAGWPDVNVVEQMLDVNKDNKVDLKDVTALSRYIAGWDVDIG